MVILSIKTARLCIVLGVLLSSLQSIAQDPNNHIYLCFGQSNMAGAGDIENQDLTVSNRFQFMKPQDCASKNQFAGNWYTAVPPLWGCSGGLGPADYFGRTLVANLPSTVKVGVVVVAIPGCKIELFGKTGFQGFDTYNYVPSKYAGSAYAWLLDLAKKAQTTGVIKGILLHQGESNTGDQAWPSKVKSVYDNLIKDLNLDPTKTPLLAGELLYQNFGSCCSGHNPVIAKLPSVIPNSHVISASGLAGKDVYHFNSAAVRTFGQRYAEKMLTLYPKGTPPVVNLTAPTNNGPFTTLQTITLGAIASDPDGSISKVEFFSGTNLLGSDITAPYSIAWSGMSAGSHLLSAKATDNSGLVSTSNVITVNIQAGQEPFNGTASVIPGRIEAENFDLGGNGTAYFDDSPGSAVTPLVNFRQNENVDIENCTDVGAGYNVGYTTAGEWLEYSVNVATSGKYNVELRVACNGTGRTLSLAMGETNIASNIPIPNTMGWQTWTTTTVNNISLTAGPQVLRMTVGATSYININYLNFSSTITGLDNEDKILGDMVYPNPFKDHLYVETKGIFQYQLTNVSGVVLEEGIANARMDFRDQYPKGMYLLKVQQGEAVKVLKLLKD